MLKAFALIASMALCPAVWAQSDSSADADEGFVEAVEESPGVILRVPINELGEENTGEAELRLHTGDVEVDSLSDAETAFEESVDLSDQVTFEEGEVQDSSTQGWYGWRGYRNYWAPSYYYSSYRPYYYNYGNYYRYSYPYYYSSPYYRYYYYNRYW